MNTKETEQKNIDIQSLRNEILELEKDIHEYPEPASRDDVQTDLINICLDRIAMLERIMTYLNYPTSTKQQGEMTGKQIRELREQVMAPDVAQYFTEEHRNSIIHSVMFHYEKGWLKGFAAARVPSSPSGDNSEGVDTPSPSSVGEAGQPAAPSVRIGKASDDPPKERQKDVIPSLINWSNDNDDESGVRPAPQPSLMQQQRLQQAFEKVMRGDANGVSDDDLKLMNERLNQFKTAIETKIAKPLSLVEQIEAMDGSNYTYFGNVERMIGGLFVSRKDVLALVRAYVDKVKTELKK